MIQFFSIECSKNLNKIRNISWICFYVELWSLKFPKQKNPKNYWVWLWNPPTTVLVVAPSDLRLIMRMRWLMVTTVRLGICMRQVRAWLIENWARMPKIINYFFEQTVHHLKINHHILPSSSLATVRCWWYRAWRAESGLTSWVKWWFGRWWCGWCWGCRGSALTLGRVVWETGLGSIQPGVKDWTGWEIHPPKSSLWKLWKNLGQLTNIEMDRN